jgi:hypothetical protein
MRRAATRTGTRLRSRPPISEVRRSAGCLVSLVMGTVVKRGCSVGEATRAVRAAWGGVFRPTVGRVGRSRRRTLTYACSTSTIRLRPAGLHDLAWLVRHKTTWKITRVNQVVGCRQLSRTTRSQKLWTTFHSLRNGSWTSNEDSTSVARRSWRPSRHSVPASSELPLAWMLGNGSRIHGALTGRYTK